MKCDRHEHIPSRRNFLKLATLGAATGTLAAATGAPTAQAAVPVKAAQGGGGYHESEHVRKYYELARF